MHYLYVELQNPCIRNCQNPNILKTELHDYSVLLAHEPDYHGKQLDNLTDFVSDKNYHLTKKEYPLVGLLGNGLYRVMWCPNHVILFQYFAVDYGVNWVGGKYRDQLGTMREDMWILHDITDT